MKSAELPTTSHGRARSRLHGEGRDRGIWRRIYEETAGYRLVALLLLFIELLATPLFLLAPIPLAIAVDSVVGDKPLPAVVDPIVPDSVTHTQLLVFAAVLQIAVVFLTDLQTLSQNVLRIRTQEKLTLRLRSRLLAHVQRLSFAFHDRRGAADLLYRIQFDSMALGTMLVVNLLPLVSATVTLVAVFVVILGINAQLALIALATTPLLAVLSTRSKKQMRHHYRESKKLESSAIGVVHEVLGNVRVIKAFGREDSEHLRFLRWGDASARKRVGIAAREGLLDLAINFITAAGTGLVLFVGAQSVLSGAISLGALLVVLSYLTRLYTPLKTLIRRVTGMQNAYESLQRAFELLDQDPDVAERPDARPVLRARGDIEFDRVSFAYEGEPPVLEDVSLRVPAGTRVGVVGRTGAGRRPWSASSCASTTCRRGPCGWTVRTCATCGSRTFATSSPSSCRSRFSSPPRSPTTSVTVGRTRARRRSGTRPGPPGSRTSSIACPMGTTPWSASAASACPAASASASRSPGRSSRTRRSWSWTSRRARWTSKPRRRSWTRWIVSRGGGPRS